MDTTNLPVLIYQPGRSGSKTIERTLCRNGIPSISIHCLAWKLILNNIKKNPQSEKLNRMRYAARRMIDTAPENVRWKIVTIVREPVAHLCSALHESRNAFFPDMIDSPDEEIFPAIIDHMHSEMKVSDTKEFYMDFWFDNEMKEVFEYDIFSVPFDQTQGFQIYRAPRADILLFKNEQLSECFQQAFSLFFGCTIAQLHNCNMTRKKSHAQMYNRVKRALKVSLCDLQHIYSKRYVTHFYHPDEIAGFIRRWVDMEQLPVKQDHTTLSVASSK